MRLFVCTFLSSEHQTFYGRQMGDLIESSGGILRAIPKDSAHITYAFLPRIDDRVLDETVKAVTTTASRHDSVAIRLGPPAILYARAEARLVYASIVQGAEALAQLGSDIVGTLQASLSDIDVSGSQAPHVTLARFRKHTHRRSASSVSDALRLPAPRATEREDRATMVQIVSSELISSGPRYDVKAVIALRGAPVR